MLGLIVGGETNEEYMCRCACSIVVNLKWEFPQKIQAHLSLCETKQTFARAKVVVIRTCERQRQLAVQTWDESAFRRLHILPPPTQPVQ